MDPSEQVFPMIAVTKVEMDGVEYGPGEKLSIKGIETVRFLMSQKAARSDSAVVEAPSPAPVEIDFKSTDTTRGTNEQTASEKAPRAGGKARR